MSKKMVDLQKLLARISDKEELNDLLMKIVYDRLASGDIELAEQMSKLALEMEQERIRLGIERKTGNHLN